MRYISLDLLLTFNCATVHASCIIDWRGEKEGEVVSKNKKLIEKGQYLKLTPTFETFKQTSISWRKRRHCEAAACMVVSAVKYSATFDPSQLFLAKRPTVYDYDRIVTLIM
jgi:hypothetical protein